MQTYTLTSQSMFLQTEFRGGLADETGQAVCSRELRTNLFTLVLQLLVIVLLMKNI